MTDTTPPVRPDDAGEQPDKPPVLQPGEADGASDAGAASAPALRPREDGSETTA